MTRNYQLNYRSAAIDLTWVLTTLLILKSVFLQFEGLWTFAGPISLIASLGVATWRLKKILKTG